MALADSVRRVANDSLFYEASDLYFHGLNLSQQFDKALRFSRKQAKTAKTCRQLARWNADQALIHERLSHEGLSVADSVKFYARRARTSGCSSELGDHRFLVAISEARALQAEGDADSAMVHAAIAMRTASNTKGLLESIQFLFENSPCERAWSTWQTRGETLRTNFREKGTALDYFRFGTIEVGLLLRFSDCAASFEANPDGLVRRARDYLRIGQRLDRPPLAMVALQTGFSGLLVGMNRLDAALRVADFSLRSSEYESRTDSLRAEYFGLLSPTLLRVLDGRYEEALDDAERLQSVAQQLDEPVLEIVADIQRGVTLLHSQQPQKATEALQHAERLLATMSEQTFRSAVSARGLSAISDPQRLLFNLYLHLGTVLGTQGQHRQSQRRYKQALTYAPSAQDSSLIYRSLAVGRRAQFDPIGSDSLRKQAERLWPEDSEEMGWTSVRNSLLDQLASSDSLIRRRGWRLSDSLLASPDLEDSSLRRAQVHTARSRYLLRRSQAVGSQQLRKRALEEAQAAISLLEKGHRTTRQWITANVDAGLASTDAAEKAKYAREAIRAARDMQSVSDLVIAARLLANVEFARGDYLAADSALDRALLAAEEQRFRSTRERRVRRRLMGIEFIESLYSDAVFLAAARRRPWKAFLIAELSKARGLSDMLLQAHVGEHLLPARRAGNLSARNQGENRDADTTGIDRILSDVRQGRMWNAEATAVDSTYIRAFRQSMRNTFGRDSLKAKLKRLDAGVLSYFRMDSLLVSWVMAGDSIWVYADSPNFDRITELSDHFASSSKASTGRRSRSAVRVRERSAASELYEILVAPVESRLSRVNAENLIIIPHDVLYRVPFSSLGPEEGPLLADRYTTTVLPALHLLGFRMQDSPTDSQASKLTFLGVGDASGSLVRSTDELSGAARYFENAAVLTDSSATEEGVRQRWKTADVLHFATHAVANDSVVNEGYVRLAPTDGDEGNLTVEEVLEARPLRAQVAVLSACQTGRGALLGGEGVMGFGRAFLAAGAKAVIVTLWPVADQVAHYFTTRFYSGWRKDHMTVPKAFAFAQQSTRNRFPAVHDWAGFVLLARDW